MTNTPRLAARHGKRYYETDPRIDETPDLSDRCLAPDVDGDRCLKTSVPGAPFSMCLSHMAEIMEFVRTTVITSPPEQDGADQAREQMTEAALIRRDAGVVYYVRVGDLVKIGTTRRPVQTRMASLPPDRQLLATEPGGPLLERERHLQFRHLRFSGEWFTPNPELWVHIASVREAHGEPTEVPTRAAS